MGKELSFVAHYGTELRYVALYFLAWLCMVFCGLLWYCSYVELWPYIALSRGHRSKFIWSCFLKRNPFDVRMWMIFAT